MNDPRDTYGDLPPEEHASIERVLARLERRPLPRPEFRGDLRRRLTGSRRAPAPANLRQLFLGYACAAVLLLGIGGLSATGAGPLAGPGPATASTPAP
jgi:hypothetical protein